MLVGVDVFGHRKMIELVERMERAAQSAAERR
jgi:hypothetical protein